MFHTLLSKLFLTKYLEKDEKVLFIAHKHHIILFWDILQVVLLGCLVPFGLVFSNPGLFPVAVVVGVFFWLRFAHQFMLWFFDCWIFTNKGVTDVRWVNLFHRQTINVGYRHCEGMTVTVKGFWQTILRMGDMVLDRDAQNAPMLLHNAYRPHRIEERFLGAKSAAAHDTKEGTGSGSEKIKVLLSEMLTEYAANKGISLED